MSTREITSLQHPFVKEWVNLRLDPHFRNEKEKVLITGYKLAIELKPDLLIVQKDHPIPKNLHPKELFFVTEAILKKITGMPHPEPIAGILQMPKEESLAGKQFILALDQITDPGNLGTLLRSALALGWQGAFLTEGSVDPFNDKAIRAAKGATFRLPLRLGSNEELLELIASEKWPVFVADLSGKNLKTLLPPSKALLILGSEGQGISPVFRGRFESVSIPMSGKMESLNVAAAGAILMYHLQGTP